MKPILKFDGVDFTWILGEGGIKWSRNDLDSQKTGRNLNGEMGRKRVAVKRKLVFDNCKRMTTAQIRALNAAIYPPMLRVTFLDAITGEPYTGTFYGSTVEATTQIYDAASDETYWDGASFSLIER